MKKAITKYRILMILFSGLLVLPLVFFYQEYVSLQNYYIENFGELNLYYEDELSLLRFFAFGISIVYYPIIIVLFFVLKLIMKKPQPEL